MNGWVRLVDEYKAHNNWIIEQVKEKNKELARLRVALEEIADPLAWETRDEALNMAKDALEGSE